jgi:hypothetical protein
MTRSRRLFAASALIVLALSGGVYLRIRAAAPEKDPAAVSRFTGDAPAVLPIPT